MNVDNPNDWCESTAWPDLWSAFRNAWTEEADRVGVVVGCSGGADSVALVRLIDAARRQASILAPLVIAHVNHQLRGRDSDRDEDHVRSLAEQLGRNMVVQHPESDRQEFRDGERLDADEASLRQVRRCFFVQTAKKYGCRYIALAHTADDQVETVLHHIVRGTGTAGLSGMSMSTPIEDDFVVRRPLLGVRRSRVRQALEEIGQNWREDRSNQESHYTRNWIRNEILPAIRQRHPGVDESFIRLVENQSQTDRLLAILGQQWVDAFVSIDRKSDSMRWLRIQTNFGPAGDCEWAHDRELARDRAVITRGLQRMFQQHRLPLRDMNQTHWHRLCDLILEPTVTPDRQVNPRSVGHLPGLLEISVDADVVRIGPLITTSSTQ